ncbi:MAG: sugar ABC transporter permease [Acidimicrobiales bacterium]
MTAGIQSAVSFPSRRRGVGGRGTRRSRRLHEGRWAALLLSPALAIVICFVFAPIALTIWISFHNWSMLTPITQMPWVGLSNYRTIFDDPVFRSSLLDTLVYVGLVVAVTVPLATLIGMLLYFPRNRLKGFARTVLFATYVIPTVAVAIVWGALYEPSYGPLAEMFKAVGLSAPAFLSSPSTALVSLVAFNIWQMLGYYTVLMVAGLTLIPGELYEVASIDGAGIVRQTFAITLPLLRRTTTFVILIALINAVQVFDPVYLLTQGGPINSTDVISYEIQRTAFEYGLAGQASAMSVSLLVVLAAVAAILIGLMRARSR